MEQTFEKFIWLVAGILLTIIFQNFINDPIKDWRTRRSKKYAKRRVADLYTDLAELEKLTSKQGDVALKLMRDASAGLNQLCLPAQIVAGSGVLTFLAPIAPHLRGGTDTCLGVYRLWCGYLFFCFSFV